MLEPRGESDEIESVSSTTSVFLSPKPVGLRKPPKVQVTRPSNEVTRVEETTDEEEEEEEQLVGDSPFFSGIIS